MTSSRAPRRRTLCLYEELNYEFHTAKYPRTPKKHSTERHPRLSIAAPHYASQRERGSGDAERTSPSATPTGAPRGADRDAAWHAPCQRTRDARHVTRVEAGVQTQTHTKSRVVCYDLAEDRTIETSRWLGGRCKLYNREDIIIKLKIKISPGGSGGFTFSKKSATQRKFPAVKARGSARSRYTAMRNRTSGVFRCLGRGGKDGGKERPRRAHTSSRASSRSRIALDQPHTPTANDR